MKNPHSTHSPSMRIRMAQREIRQLRERWPVTPPLAIDTDLQPEAVAKLNRAYKDALHRLEELLLPMAEASQMWTPTAPPPTAEQIANDDHMAALRDGVPRPAESPAQRAKALASQHERDVRELHEAWRAEHGDVVDAYGAALTESLRLELELAAAVFDARAAGWVDELHRAAGETSDPDQAHLIDGAARRLKAWQHDPAEPEEDRRRRLATRRHGRLDLKAEPRSTGRNMGEAWITGR